MTSVKILVVEDEVIVARDIADMLKSQGYDVPAIALSGEQAIQKTEQIQPDLVLMDIVLKGDVDGIEAAEQIRHRFDIPVIYLTAYTDAQTVKRAKITEPFGYITKPFDKRELYTNIEMALYKHKMEKSLRRERDKAQKYLDVAAIMLVAIDTEQRVGLINKKGCELLGYKEEEIIAKNWFDNFLPSRIKDETKAVFEKLIRADVDASEYCENPILTKSGDERLIAWHNTVLRDEKGSVIATLSSGEDITERKKAEEQIAKLAKFPDEDPYPVLRISGHGTVVYANKASAILLKTWDCRVGRSVTDRWHELVMDSLSSGQSQQTEVQCDGRIFSLTFAPVVDANYVNVYGLDITARKKAEQELAWALAWQEAIFEGSRDAVFISDADSKFVTINSSACKLTGYSREELLGMRIPELHEEQDLTAYNLYHDRIMAGEEIISEAKILRKDGTKVDTEFNNRCIKISGTAYMHTVARNITERKKSENELIENQAKLKAMASKILQTEERERQSLAMGLHDEVCQKLVLTKLALESSLNLVSDPKVLASLKITCGAIGETIEQADSLTFELSNPVLRQLGFVIALEKYLTEEIRQKHGIAYELEGDKQLSTLPDEIKNGLFRVTRELLTNVVKHAHARKVKVSARESQGQIYVRVQDDGVGFKESQAGSKVSQTARFGLFSIREQLEYLGGHLEIESEPGRGTKATMVVPLTKNAIV